MKKNWYLVLLKPGKERRPGLKLTTPPSSVPPISHWKYGLLTPYPLGNQLPPPPWQNVSYLLHVHIWVACGWVKNPLPLERDGSHCKLVYSSPNLCCWSTNKRTDNETPFLQFRLLLLLLLFLLLLRLLLSIITILKFFPAAVFFVGVFNLYLRFPLFYKLGCFLLRFFFLVYVAQLSFLSCVILCDRWISVSPQILQFWRMSFIAFPAVILGIDLGKDKPSFSLRTVYFSEWNQSTIYHFFWKPCTSQSRTKGQSIISFESHVLLRVEPMKQASISQKCSHGLGTWPGFCSTLLITMSSHIHIYFYYFTQNKKNFKMSY